MTELARSLDRSSFRPHVGCFYRNGVREAELREAGLPLVEFPVRSFASPSVLRAAMQFGKYAELPKSISEEIVQKAGMART